ncbi:MAG TPA: DegT/DnrJ/EryC1/StrS family aminotransferase [Candidatus Hydrogenedentes bacterium]|nr:DegT/DnrJ/EryC1/StrS family aminotransferase [Candidatus Hydrogenedentota bacterium]HOT49354.1 DegT/DnrJ/EryC1/StrS family aminotransferase [Candidatus Hydrogenedentota bacterium]HOV73973.1 DegT/DnrJ/EryC1/StrS family aminotransferase [Candidatus Hydrogenedentota bacterium]HPC14806.1 DegT/DnrJ/EryC1/StrS family aminotransferase [Candidatus Hydrogenedentota bacterium]HRT18670.1 DegT/DnrJ/EryC1/StrS family aminotransferase [Candidatus Hydrogenedentota bacterium]
MIPRRWVNLDSCLLRDIRDWMQTPLTSDKSEVREWERRFAEYVGMPDAAALHSGRRALMLIVEHMGLRRGDEMIVPAYTFGEILHPIQALGIRLIPADIDPVTLNATPESISVRITSRTRAILALHVFGVPCRIAEITDMAASRGIGVVEDCAHALGSSVAGRPVGTFGEAALFSFEMTKPVNTFGGGMLVGRDPMLLDRARAANDVEPLSHAALFRKIRATQFEQFLFRSRLAFPLLYLLSTPSWRDAMNRLYRRSQEAHRSHERYSSVRARLGLRELETLEERLQWRRRRAAQYRQMLRDDIRCQQVSDGLETTHYFFVAILPRDAAAVRRRLLFKGIDAGVEEEIMDNCAAMLGYPDCPNVDYVFRRAIALPMYDGITEDAVSRVAEAVNASI